MAYIFFAVANPLLIAFGFFHFVKHGFPKPSIFFIFIFSLVFGFAVTSLGYFIWLIVFHRFDSAFILIESSSTGIITFWALRDNKIKILPANIKFTKSSIFSLMFLVIFTMQTFILIRTALDYPHGMGDSWAIWNLRARFLSENQGIYWKNGFSEEISWSHPDYPLFLSASIARFWSYINSTNLLVPIIFSVVITSLTILTLFILVKKISNNFFAFTAGLILLSTPAFVTHGASQFSDNLLGLQLLIVFGLLNEISKKYSKIIMFSLGLCASILIWIKNEGWLMFVGMSFFVLFYNRKSWRRNLISFSIGALPFLITVLYQKYFIAPQNDLFIQQSLSDLTHKIFDLSRYLTVINELYLHLSEFQGLNSNSLILILLMICPLIIIANIQKKNYLFLISFILFLFILSGYLSIYIITPHNLINHINSSLNRLLLQLWPSYIFIIFNGLATIFNNYSDK